MVLHLLVLGHLHHLGHSHIPALHSVILAPGAECTLMRLATFSLLTMSTRSCKALSKPARLICSIAEQLRQATKPQQNNKHSCHCRCVMCTCNEKVAPLVLKLCSAKILSLRVMSGLVLTFAKVTVEHLTECLQLTRRGALNMQPQHYGYSVMSIRNDARKQMSRIDQTAMLTCMTETQKGAPLPPYSCTVAVGD